MDEKERNMKKIGRKMSICMALTLSFFLSLIGMISSGHFEPVGWIINFAVCAVIKKSQTAQARNSIFNPAGSPQDALRA